MQRIKHLLVSLVIGAFSSQALAAAFFFPDINPNIVGRDTPAWLTDGFGNDGYVTITTEVIPTSSCVPLSNHSFWGSDKTQLIISVTTNGFDPKINKKDIPIATFDGRNSGGECASLSTLPMKIVQYGLLKPFSITNPGHLSIIVNVKTSNNSSQDFIGPVQFLLNTAALVATGGASATISSLTTTASNPVLSQTQERTNKMLQGLVNGKTPITLNWQDVRSGIDVIEIPVYRAEGSLGSTPDKKIQQLQTDPNAEKSKLFDIRLSFSYTKTLFDPAASGIDDLPNREGISTSNVLNYPNQPGTTNFLQILNNSSPSLMQLISKAEGKDLTNACSMGFEKLKNAGLANLDTAIVMKAFIDESKGSSDWYQNPNHVKACFAQAPNVLAYLEKVYGPSEPKFVIGDIQEGVGKPYQDWKDFIGPTLVSFRQNLIAKEELGKTLYAFNNQKDIEVSFTPDVQKWIPDNNPDDLPQGIATLASKQFKTMGCFIYRESTNLNPKTPGAYAILEESNGNFWLASLKLGTDNNAKITKMRISNLNADWKAHFKTYRFPGGECAGILNRLN